MNVVVTRRFEKDAEKELPKDLQLELADTIEKIKDAQRLSAIANLKKLSGYKTAY